MISSLIQCRNILHTIISIIYIVVPILQTCSIHAWGSNVFTGSITSISKHISF